MENDLYFDTRRKTDPQGVINDLLAQITRQATAIYELNNRLEGLGASVEAISRQKLEKAKSQITDIDFVAYNNHLEANEFKEAFECLMATENKYLDLWIDLAEAAAQLNLEEEAKKCKTKISAAKRKATKEKKSELLVEALTKE